MKPGFGKGWADFAAAQWPIFMPNWTKTPRNNEYQECVQEFPIPTKKTPQTQVQTDRNAKLTILSSFHSFLSEIITPPTNTHKSGNETRYDVQQTPHLSNSFEFPTCEVSNSADLQRCHPIVSQCGSPLRTMSNKVVSLMARSWAIFLVHSLAKLERR